MSFAIDTLINVFLAGFFLVMVLDFLSGLREIWVRSAPPPLEAKDTDSDSTLDEKDLISVDTLSGKGLLSKHTLDEKGVVTSYTLGGNASAGKKGVVTNPETHEKGVYTIHPPGRNQQTLTVTESEDPWLAALEVIEPCCCTTIAAPLPLLLALGSEVPNPVLSLWQ